MIRSTLANGIPFKSLTTDEKHKAIITTDKIKELLNNSKHSEDMKEVILRYLIRLTLSKIPIEYWNLHLDSLKVSSEYKDTVGYYIDNIENAADKGMGVFFTGSNGIGKTSMMCEIGKVAVAHCFAVQYFTVYEYVTGIQNGDTEIWDSKINSAGFCLIDEIDKKYMKSGSDFVVKTVDNLFRKILNAGKVIIACTNWTLDEIRENFGESISSLIFGKCKIVNMIGSDYRSELQESFFDRLTSAETSVDVESKHIINLAQTMENYIWQE